MNNTRNKYIKIDSLSSLGDFNAITNVYALYNKISIVCC